MTLSHRLLAAVLLLGSATAAAAQTPPPPAPAGLFGNPRRFVEPTGADVYRAVCAGCHMPNGRGAEGAGAYPSLAGDAHLATPGYPIEMVLHGHGGMPAFARWLTDDQIAAVVAYIRQNFGNHEEGTPTPADVAAAR